RAPWRSWAIGVYDAAARRPPRKELSMRATLRSSLVLFTVASVALGGCSESTNATPDAEAPGDAGPGDGGFVLPSSLERFCAGKDAPAAMKVGKTGALSGGQYLGVVTQADVGKPVDEGTWEVMNLAADAPFLVDTIRVAFGRGSGMARIHLTPAFGNSYPATY